MSSPEMLSNRYELGDTLGYGGMSEVHRGRDVRLDRDVAVKVLRADLSRDPTFQLRFRREAQNAAALNHPAIVAVYDTGETDSEYGPLPYIVMEYVDGRTLRDVVKSEGPLPPRRAMEVMADASAALDFSHRHGIVHRDVKPANIMITSADAVKVMDFGIARAVTADQSTVTGTAAVIGTAQYLSPEQARGETVDGRSDVYASGCVLFELLTGEPPFTGDSPVAVAYQHVREDPRAPSDVNPQVPASLDAVVLKALSKNPANRYQSAGELRSDLVRVLNGQRPKAPMVMSHEERTSMMGGEPSAPTEAGPYRPVPPPDDELGYEEDRRRRRRKGWLIAVIALLAVGLFTLVTWLAVRATEAPPANMGAVPNLQNQQKEAAVRQINASGFQPAVQPTPSPRQQINLVVRQQPNPGPAPKNTKITIFVGTGPVQVQVPSLKGKSPDQAQAALQKIGLNSSADQQPVETDDPDLWGKVVSSSPSGGETVDKGSSVKLQIGKEPQKLPVPALTGQNVDGARSILSSMGFQVSVQQQHGTQKAGTVLSQDPSPQTRAKKGSRVTLFVSDGQQLQMPSLQGMKKDEAQSQLQSLGWSGSIAVQPVPTSDISKVKTVQSSDPPQGSTFSKNQTVTLRVYKFGSGSGSSSSSTSTSHRMWPPIFGQ